MSRLLVMRPVEGRVEVVLADNEECADGLRVFTRGAEVVLRLSAEAPVVVRDIRQRQRSSARVPPPMKS